MVRIKNRYLLINILYPSEITTKSNNSSLNLPNVVIFRQPSPKGFNSDTLRNYIRSSVQNLFGEYGAGALGASLRGMTPALQSSAGVSSHAFITENFRPNRCNLTS